MKKLIYLLIFPILIFVGCNSSSHEGHSHAKDATEEHNHEGHNHDANEADHEHGGACDHDHEGEEADHDHSHGSSDDHSDEIIFTPEQAKAAGLTTETVQAGDFRQVIKTSGQLISAPSDEVIISAPVSGIVSFQHANMVEGIAVQKNQVLLTLSARNVEDGDPVQRAKLRFDIAKKDYDRAQKLKESQLISEKEYNEIKLTYESARLAYQSFAGQTRTDGAEVKASVAGFMVKRFVTEGDYVSVGQPLFTIAANKKMTLRAEVSERYYHQLGGVSSANFKTAYDNNVHKLSDLKGKFVSFGKSLSGDGYLVPVTFEFDNNGGFMSGSYVEVYLLGGERQKVISVPQSALVEEQGLFFVYKQLDEEGYQRQSVKLGQSNGDRVELISGIAEGDVVVTQGAYHVKLASASASIPHGHEH